MAKIPDLSLSTCRVNKKQHITLSGGHEVWGRIKFSTWGYVNPTLFLECLGISVMLSLTWLHWVETPSSYFSEGPETDFALWQNLDFPFIHVLLWHLKRALHISGTWSAERHVFYDLLEKRQEKPSLEGFLLARSKHKESQEDFWDPCE